MHACTGTFPPMSSTTSCHGGNLPAPMVAEFLTPVQRQGSVALVRFTSLEAPHHRLTAGARFHFYEGPRCVATGEVVLGASVQTSSNLRDTTTLDGPPRREAA